ncbi:MAG: DNA methyltransferase [Patescibacteria group bacterium]
MSALKVVSVSITELNVAQYNPRKISADAFEQIKESIRRFGLLGPIIVNSAPNRRNIVIGGHQRMKAAKALDFEKIPVLYVNIPDEIKEKELNLRLNQNTGEWDMELLKEFDIDLLLDVGFDDFDLQEIWDDSLEVEDDNFDVEEKLKEIKKPSVKEGDIYALGKHRLICGDSTKTETLKAMINDTKVSFVTLDPPYNIGLDYSNGIGTKRKYGGTKVKDDKSPEAYKDFLKTCIKNAVAFVKPDTHFFTWNDERNIGCVQQIYEELAIRNKRVCLWLKNSQMSTPQVAFSKVYEPCIYGTRGEPFLSTYHTSFTEVMNKELGTGNRLHGDVLDLFNIWLEKRLPATDYEHPTQKPPSLYERAIRRCTKPGDILLELFGGSGSVLIAAEQLKRTCYLVELDPLFCQLIINRYENLTGQKATKLN